MTHDSLGRELESLADRAASPIRRWRLRRVWPDAVRAAVRTAWIGPVVLLAFEVLRAAGAGSVGARGWGELALFLLGIPGVVLVVQMVVASRRAVDRRDALAAVDDAASLQGRLVTADEFLGRADRDGFVAAAIEDAEQHLERARAAQLQRFEGAPEVRIEWPRVLVAVALIAIACWLAPAGFHRDGDDGGRDDVRTTGVARGAAGDESDSSEPPPIDPVQPNNEPRGDAADSEDSRNESEVGDDVKETRGRLGAGRPAEASSSQGASNSKAAPTNQGQSAKVEEQKVPAKKKKPTPPKPQPDGDPPPKKQQSEDSGTTAGKGSSRGSNKNPASSDWSSKDQVTNPEDEAVEDDDEIEDEEDEQESRGGIQPNLRDRKPPVNRDLRIGFGNRKNPDANGRGGPSEQKKSRGVASLVLGVPVPDRIKGQPNRGKTKITQERIEPKAENSEPVAAESRAPRQRPIGALNRLDLEAAMRAVIRKYFLTPPPSRP